MLVSHSHMDHVKDLALLADQVIGRRKDPIELHCGPETAETLRSSYFNNYLWPDFTTIPTPEAPVMRIRERQAGAFRIPPRGHSLEEWDAAGKNGPQGGPLEDGELEVQYIPVTHPVESMAMIVRSNTGSILYSSDTGPTQLLWDVANAQQDLKGMFVELSFPNHMQALADVAGHFTPQTLKKELTKFERADDTPLYIYHLKPSFYEQTRDEVLALDLPKMHLVELTDEFSF